METGDNVRASTHSRYLPGRQNRMLAGWVGSKEASGHGRVGEFPLSSQTPAEPNVRISRIRLPDYLVITRRERNLTPGNQNHRCPKYQLFV